MNKLLKQHLLFPVWNIISSFNFFFFFGQWENVSSQNYTDLPCRDIHCQHKEKQERHRSQNEEGINIYWVFPTCFLTLKHAGNNSSARGALSLPFFRWRNQDSRQDLNLNSHPREPKAHNLILHHPCLCGAEESTMALTISGKKKKHVLTKWTSSVPSQAQKYKGGACAGTNCWTKPS